MAPEAVAVGGMGGCGRLWAAAAEDPSGWDSKTGGLPGKGAADKEALRGRPELSTARDPGEDGRMGQRLRSQAGSGADLERQAQAAARSILHVG